MGNKLSNDSKFTKPTGLYTNCSWDEKTVKKLIKGGKVAPRYPGQEEPGPELDKCPICFLVSLRLFSKVHSALPSHLVLRAWSKDLHRCCSHTLFFPFPSEPLFLCSGTQVGSTAQNVADSQFAQVLSSISRSSSKTALLFPCVRAAVR